MFYTNDESSDDIIYIINKLNVTNMKVIYIRCYGGGEN